jgi:hypothetical protein
MTVSRDWVTPITMGAFALMAVTGVMMFFGVRPGLTTAAHEWLSWAFLVGVLGHVTANFLGFRRHLGSTRTRVIVGGFAALLVIALVAKTFLPSKPEPEPGWATPVRALAKAPLAVVAQVGQMSSDELKSRLSAQGVTAPITESTTIADLAGPDYEQQKNLLRKLYNPPKPADAAKSGASPKS